MPGNGPLQASSTYHVTIPAAVGTVVHLEAYPPSNTTGSDITILSVELIGARNIEIVGLLATYAIPQPDGVCLSSGNGNAFPPPGYRTAALDGAVIPRGSARTCSNVPLITIGARRPSSVPAVIDDVRVRYRFQRWEYLVMLGQSYEIRPP